MSEDEKLAACKDPRILAVVSSEISALGCPANESGLPSWFESNRVTDSLQPLLECHESLKLRLRVLGQQATADWGAQALTALTTNPQNTVSVWQVIKTHQTLVKTGVAGIDTAFRAKAKQLFPLATYFAGGE